MNVFGIGLPEMAVIMVLALLIFGPKKLPEIGRSLGKAIKGFQEASNEFQNEFKREAEQLEKVVNRPMQAKLEEPEPPALSPATETTVSPTPIVDGEPVASATDSTSTESSS